MIDLEKINQHLDQMQPLLEPFSYDFAKRMYAGGLAKYERRLRQVGFGSCSRVLDAGSGTGQWALALSEFCNEVTGVDVLEGRVFMLDALAKAAGVKNLRVEYGSLKRLRFAPASFDGIICYGVIFTTGAWQTVLAELFRVLEPGGLLYLTGNGPGYYRKVWQEQPNKMEGHDPRKWAALAFYNTWRIEQGLEGIEVPLQIIPPDEMVAEAKRIGFVDVQQGGEGMLRDASYKGETEAPFGVAQYKDDVAAYELVARKPR
jgi:ubiquinone/menaquinone biosynthesis C-methylase UbiE